MYSSSSYVFFLNVCCWFFGVKAILRSASNWCYVLRAFGFEAYVFEALGPAPAQGVI